jgi:hypothetical protein
MFKAHSLTGYKFTPSISDTEDPSLSQKYDKESIGLALSGSRLSLYAILILESQTVPHVIILQSIESQDVYSLYLYIDLT